MANRIGVVITFQEVAQIQNKNTNDISWKFKKTFARAIFFVKRIWEAENEKMGAKKPKILLRCSFSWNKYGILCRIQAIQTACIEKKIVEQPPPCQLDAEKLLKLMSKAIKPCLR